MSLTCDSSEVQCGYYYPGRQTAEALLKEACTRIAKVNAKTLSASMLVGARRLILDETTQMNTARVETKPCGIPNLRHIDS